MEWWDKLAKGFMNGKAKKLDNSETKENAIGPWVKVVDVHFDKDNPTQGYFELDWNDDFVGLLGESGYAGETPEAIVDLWFNDLCRSVALEAQGEDENN